MSKVVGIDLGTTYSAVAILEERSGEGFLPVPGCPGVSVILDDNGQRITPSVVGEDALGRIDVGYAPKGRAGKSPEPIMFSKRHMGEEYSYTLRTQGTLTPMDAATHILRYLKGMAERRLGEPITGAVVTVPAYFQLKARQMTKLAAEAAGLRVLQIAQEPVAAALMYCANDRRDPLRIMTYDLGGGTFDVSLLAKIDGVIGTHSVLAVDGNPFLGGFNFDSKLADWLLLRLIALGYDLRLNFADPADREIHSRLMVLAERAKVKLGTRAEYEFPPEPTGITDHAGRPVDFAQTKVAIARADFEAMIEPLVDETLALCDRAFTRQSDPKKAVSPGDLDEIVMVGGSSRVPLIGRKLQQKYGRKPKLVEPDLCVAAGAALLTRPFLVSQLGRFLRLNPFPNPTNLPSLTLTGQASAPSPGCTVRLEEVVSAKSHSRKPGADGVFAFPDVPLREEAENDFVLSMTASDGTPLDAQPLKVRHSAGAASAAGGEVGPTLTKPIGVQLFEGPEFLAPPGTPLPHTTRPYPARTRNASGQIRIPIIEDVNPLGEILITDVPATLPVGSTVEVTLAIGADFAVTGRALVQATGSAAEITVHIPLRPMPTEPELRRRLADLDALWRDARAAADPGKLFAAGKRIEDRLKVCRQELRPDADLSRLRHELDELEALIRELRPVVMQPSRYEFDATEGQVNKLLANAAEKRLPEVESGGYAQKRLAIRRAGDEAYEAKEPDRWKAACENMRQLQRDLKALVEPPPQRGAYDPAADLRACATELSRLEDAARENGRLAANRAAFDDAARSLKQIKPSAGDAQLQLSDWYTTQFLQLKRQVLDDGGDTDDDLPGRHKQA